MIQQVHTQPFPIDALPPSIRELVLEIHRNTQAPVPSVVSAVLAAISLVCQGKIKVRKRPGLISPISLWFIVVLGSGERKTAVMKLVFEAIEKFMVDQDELYRQKLDEYQNKYNAWEAQKGGILDAIRKKCGKNQPTDEEQERLDELNKHKPKKPKRFKLIHERMSPQALIKNLSECYPTTGIISDEAVSVFSSRGLSDMGVLNKGWDGSTISQELSSDESRVVHDPCITLALYAQREIVEKFFQGKGALSRSVGFLARCYYVMPQDTAGFRNLAYSVPVSTEVIDTYKNRCKEILLSQIDPDGQSLPEKRELIFSPEAQSRWEREHDGIESMMRPGGFLCNDRDFGSKHADKIARLAALLHYFTGEKGAITLDTLERAIAISAWYAEEFVYNFAKPLQLPQEQQDAELLLVWLANYIRTTGDFFIKKNDIRQHGPNPIRNRNRLNSALTLLWQRGIVNEARSQNGKTCFVVMNDQYFTPQQVHHLCGQKSL